MQEKWLYQCPIAVLVVVPFHLGCTRALKAHSQALGNLAGVVGHGKFKWNHRGILLGSFDGEKNLM